MNRTPVKAGTFYVTALGALTLLTILVGVITLGGCNTVRGAAQLVAGVATDIEAAADGIQHQMAETDQ